MTESLIDEAYGILGMIAEAKAKARFLIARIQEEKQTRKFPSMSLQERVDSFLEQTLADLDTYDRRLDEIVLELADHGTEFPGMVN